MSQAQELLQEITKVGVSVCLDIDDCDTLRIEAPMGAVTDQMKDRLAEHKQEIVRILKNIQAANQPYINERGVLVIPCDSESRYRWWAGGQTILETLRELKASPEVIAMYGPSGAA